jgi:flagellar hook-associated protein 2
MDIDLLSTSEEPVHVRLVPDEDKITDKLNDFLNSYNQLVDIARNGSSEKGATKLFRDITSITTKNQAALEAAGLSVEENGYMHLAEDADSSQIKALFDEDLSSFRKDIQRTTEKMTLNPLNYIDKVVVTYPNTRGTYPNPYNPSKYSGLLFNDYA